MRNSISVILLAALLLSSCITSEKLRKELVYFNQGLDSAAFGNFTLEEPVIQKGDLLQIVISSRSPSANVLFSQNVVQPSVGGDGGGGSGAINPSANQYLVDIATGEIKLPLLGNIKAEGLTKSKLEKEIIAKTLNYISEEPVVNIRYMNFRVTFLGNVAKPGTIIFNTERVSFLQALGEAGGVIPGGDLKNILLFREQDSKRTSHKIDLTNTVFMNSPENFLRQNDVIYVGSTERQLLSYDILTQRRLQYITLGFSVLNIVFLLANYFR